MGHHSAERCGRQIRAPNIAAPVRPRHPLHFHPDHAYARWVFRWLQVPIRRALWVHVPSDSDPGTIHARQERQRQNHPPVVFGITGILVIEPRIYLYVADCPVDKDYGYEVSLAIKRRSTNGQKNATGPEAMPEM